MAVRETHRDIYPLFQGTHKGSTGLVIYDPGAEFKSCGAAVGLAVKNSTDATTGAITIVNDEDTLTTTISFDNGDTYQVFCTDTYNKKISSIYTDKRHGRKVTDQRQLVDGLFPEDRDLDEDNEDRFGPGQPERR